MLQVAVGRMSHLSIYGDDYSTFDGTGVRDYIHVLDLVDGHLRALDRLAQVSGVSVWNLGTGHGYSVLEMVRAFEGVIGRSLPYRIVPRRAGDIAQCWADASKAERDLDWKASRGVHAMLSDSWRWQRMNPQGYRSNEQPPVPALAALTSKSVATG